MYILLHKNKFLNWQNRAFGKIEIEIHMKSGISMRPGVVGIYNLHVSTYDVGEASQAINTFTYLVIFYFV